MTQSGWNPEEKPQSDPMCLHGYSAWQGTGARLGSLPLSLACGAGWSSVWTGASEEAESDEGSASTEVRGPGSMWREATRAGGPEPGGSCDRDVA